ncbi:S-layer homology domain-containing protein [Collinsella ihumii]|uniref:S-layer homology domain-containing protein n=1 Tax=Collinsella ihumii TaxID=1720204 RepID=A0AAW7K4Y5_9ACTN|nr:S-layer homology domain-containing protein [Collinsella ihumii]MDN0070026.1 S-layer homology domain-containing protein [Collinsella ihumii]
MSDADTVSDWAEENVAWAVENGVLGNGGYVAGHSNITRAEVAAMAVNYQPEAL